MELKEIHSYSPAKFAYHLNTNPLSFAIHPSSFYLAYVTRGNEVAFYNRKTGRTAVLLNSKHGIEKLLFTENYLLIIERTIPDILVFSIKTQKLKKKLTGHRSQVLTLAYCPQRTIFCTASHDVCFIWDEMSLALIKMLKCSTSSYCDCHFTFNGQYLFTAFSDGNVFGWDLQNYNPKQYALSIQPHRLASTNNHFIAAYSQKKVSVADFSQISLLFQTIEPFWQGYIEHVDFIDSFMLIKTTHGFYLAEIVQEHKIHLKNYQQLIDPIYQFDATRYNSQVIVISKDLSKIRTMRIFREGINDKIPLTNNLINPGNQCIGGYSNKHGCTAGGANSETGYNYSTQNYKLQSLNDGMYHQSLNVFSDEKVKAFIRKNFIFPDKYRPVTYKSLLHLPISKNQFRELERKGRHPCVKMLDSKYPLDNLNMSEAMKDIISLLAHYSPVFGQSDLVPTLVFPFVCIFGEDRFFCFEVLYRLFNNWLACLFENFPLANSQLLQNIQQIFQKQDQALLNHLNGKGISFTKLTWSLLSTLFSTNLARDGFLAVTDTLISHPQDPSFLIFIVIAYIEYNRTRIFSMKSQKDLDTFLDEEHTVNISHFIKKAYQLREKYLKLVRYSFRPVNFRQNHYLQFDDYPKHAVKMYEGKRKLQEQQYDKVMNEQRYHQQISKEMGKMVTKIKRQSDKAVIQNQAVALQSQNESKYTLNMPKANLTQRKNRLNELMSKLEEMLQNRNDKKLRVKEFIPLIHQLQGRQNQEQLDQIEQRLMDLMTKLELHQFNLPLASQPMSFGKQKIDDFKAFRTAKRAQLANKLWESDKMAHLNQEIHWENDFQKAMEH